DGRERNVEDGLSIRVSVHWPSQINPQPVGIRSPLLPHCEKHSTMQSPRFINNSRSQLVLALLLLATALPAPAAASGGYADYLASIEKRNQRLHDDYLGSLADGQRSFLDDLNGHVADLQARHYVSDSAYPAGFDADRYWSELLERTAQAADAQRAARSGLGELDDDRLVDDSDIVVGGGGPARREEEPFLNRIWGAQKVSGGAGEPGQVTGPEDRPQPAKVMSDTLPSYCNPPNPCPVGADPAKLTAPCDSHVSDTAEYNRNDALTKMAAGQCPCDNEHMECPAGSVGINSKKASQMGGHLNPFLLGNKRDKLDAKKSPRYSISKRGVRAKFQSRVMEKKNPWLDGVDALDTVEKKAGRHVYLEEPLVE
ncbi:hypothetical protein BOX15_Mlig031236g3, partial [Macrostomum lignano]